MLKYFKLLVLLLFITPVYADGLNVPFPSLPLSVSNGGTGASSIPNFKVHLEANQTLTSGTTATAAFDTTDFDTGSYWDNTNKRYNPKVAGTYKFCGALLYNSSFTLSSGNVLMTITRNGSIIESAVQASVPTGNLNNSSMTCSVVKMNGSTDYVTITINVTGTSPILVGSVVPYNQFSGYRIGS